MYGKWLFKEIKTEYGLCKVEIFRKNFTDTAIEIGALESNSLTLAMENLGNITDPIGKSVCSFSIIDTDQIDYDEFFTPDATAYMVVVSTKTGEGAYVTRWSGYITPDFFAENLSYRTPISISARDNIGYLNDVDFDLDASTITVRGLIEAAFNRIAEDYPMQIVFATQKQTAEGVLAIDATISTMLLREGSWYEAIETVLHDLGLQMRWVDNNTIAVLDLSQIPEYYATQAFNFVDASGYREILPAWRELAQEQDYGLRENFFEGQINNANLRFVKEETLNLPLSMGGVTGNPVMKYYAPSNWGVAGSTLTINTDNYKYIGSYGQEPSGQGGRIYFTGVQKDAANLPQNYMSYRQPVYVSQRGKMSIAFNTFNSLLATNKTSAETLQVYNPADRFMDFATGDSLQLGLKVNVFLHVGTKTFILGDTWEEITGAETNSLYFTLDKVGQLGANGTTTPTEQEITIDVNTIPYNGELELRIYGFCIHEKTNLQEDAGLATYDWLKMVSYIDDVRYSYERELATGQGAKTEIAPLHNVKESKSYKFGQVPVYAGGINAYAGGLYNASKNMESMVLFQRNANATSYNLLELVGREVIHFNKKNYNKLSGTIRNLAKEPLMFNRLFVRNGKRYAPFAYSLNIISNQMEITTMQEVENYVTESFSEINSAVTTGGAIVSAGNNTVMQYSQDAGNTKRIYELTVATEEEKKDTWVMIDGTAFPEARKINVKDLEGLNEEQVEAYLAANAYAKESWVTNITKGLAQDIANRVLIEDFEKLEGSVSGIAGYFTSGSANNALKLGGQLPSYYATKSALDTTNGKVVSLTQRMGTAESGISTNKTNIATLITDLSNLTSRVSTAEGTIKSHTDSIALNANNIASNAKSITTNATAITAVSNRVQKFEDVIGIDSNGDVYIKGTRNFYTAGGTIGMAGLGSGGSGGGGTAGLGSVTVRVNGQDYITDASGIVTLPNYPSLAGYATEQWVASRGYITNAALNGYAKLTDIPTSLPASDVYSWAKAATKPTYTASEVGALSTGGGTLTGDLTINSTLRVKNYLKIVAWPGYGEGTTDMWYNGNTATIHSGASHIDLHGNSVLHTGNYSDYALPLSGGTIKAINGSVIPLSLKSDATDACALGLGYGSSTAYLIYYGGTDWRVSAAGWSSENPLIHSGNIGSYNAGSADVIATTYANQSINIGAESKVRLISLTASNSVNLGAPRQYVSGLSVMSSYVGWQLVSGASEWENNDFYIRKLADNGAYLSWKQLAFIDSNVASATKLQTARSIWGQSFDGTDGVFGDIILNYKNATLNTNSAKLKFYTDASLISGPSIQGLHAQLGYGAKHLVFYQHNTNGYEEYEAMRITIGGNVLIGTTSDTGDKLRVYGSLRADGVITGTSAIKISWSGASTCGLYPNDWISSDGVNSRLWLYNDNQLALYGSEIQLRNNTSILGNLTATGDITSEGTIAMAKLASSSDRKLKDNIAEVSAEQSMGVIRQLRPTTWSWKKDGKKSYGFIAQEVEPIVPEMVVNMEHLHLEYNQLHAFEIGAIQHIDSEVEILKRRVNELENELKQYRRA